MVSNWVRKVIPISVLLCDAIISKPSVLWDIYAEEMKNSEIYAETLESIQSSPISLQSTSDRHEIPQDKSKPEIPKKEVLQTVYLPWIPGCVLLYLIFDYFFNGEFLTS